MNYGTFLKHLDQATAKVEALQRQQPVEHRRLAEALMAAKNSLIDAIREAEHADPRK